MRQQGLAATFAYTRQQVDANPSFARDCHPLMHMLGHASYVQFGGFQAASAQQDEVCNSGFIHGLIEAAFGASDDPTQTALSICQPTTNNDFKSWQCNHGVGHGVMLVHNRSVDKSVASCRQLQSDFAIDACVNGVYMEHFIVIDHGGARRTGDEPSLADCRQAESRHKASCYYYAPTAYLALTNDSYGQAYDWCQQSEANFVSACVGGIASQAMKDAITRPQVAADICASYPERHQASCVGGAIGMYINVHASTAKAEPLCAREFKAFAQVCRQRIEDRRQQFKI